MKFEIKRKSVFEISGIKRIIVNTIKIVDGKKEKVGKTFVWEITQTKKGLRWFKYDLELLEELKKNCETPEEFREFADKAIIDGVSPAEMHNSIQDSMHQKMVRIWFSGETCNVERNLTKFHDALVKGTASAVAEIVHNAVQQLEKVERDAGVR